LRDRFENANFQKQKLKAQITDCEIKMRRALELTGGLSGEKGRWKETAERLQVQMEGLLGDMLLAVGYLSYMGAFTAAYRTKILEQKWAPLVKQ
jgi:dynein heavy chain